LKSVVVEVVNRAGNWVTTDEVEREGLRSFAGVNGMGRVEKRAHARRRKKRRE